MTSMRRWASKRRLAIQIVVALLTIAAGVQFTLWVTPHLQGRWPKVHRPPSVEGFLPINAMLSLRHLLTTGKFDHIHPAGLTILMAALTVSFIFPRSFCSHICPIGFLSETLERIGEKLVGAMVTPPRIVDLPLRSLKFLLLAFFMWAIWIDMSISDVAAFISSPYAKVADAKLWLFFRWASPTVLAVLVLLIVASVFIRDAWCRYLCPYGALLGLIGRLSPTAVSRNPELCTSCKACTEACPARLNIHLMETVRSVECTCCLECVNSCPVDGALELKTRLPQREKKTVHALRAATAVALIFFGILLAARLTGHWKTSVSEEEFHHHLMHIGDPAYSHPGAVSQRRK